MNNQETELKKKEVLRLSNAQSNQLTRECIRTALIYLMNEQSFDKITITSIINRSGISRAGFYRNYSSKEDVLQEIGQLLSDTLVESATNAKYENNPRQWYSDVFTAIQENHAWFQLFIQAKMPPDFIFHSAQKTEQELLKLPPMDRYRKIAMQQAFTTVVIHWFQNGMQESPEEMSDLCCSLFP